MPSTSVKECVRTLVTQNLSISFAESATAGRFASEFSLVPDSGKILHGGIVCYDPSVKTEVLNVPPIMIDKHTAESAEVTKTLAENLRLHFNTDVILAVTGLASPGGSETPEKPVGTMFLHIFMPHGYIAHRELFEGSQEEIILKTIDRACEIMSETIKNTPKIYNINEHV